MEGSSHPTSRTKSAGNVPASLNDVNEVRMEFLARSDNVSFARTAVAVFASRLDFTLDELDELKVAISEAVSNCVLHAYPDGRGWVRLRMRIVDGALEVEVSDDGVGIADPEAARQAGVTSRPDDCMGLGFTFMAEYMEDLELDTGVGAGTRLKMSKRPAAASKHAAPKGGAVTGEELNGAGSATGHAKPEWTDG